MPRRRLAVALLAPVGAAEPIDTLRRAVGVPEPFHVAPHCTLIPPVNVRDEDLGEVRDTLRRSAAAGAPFELSVGPATTFAPQTPTLHLAVGGSPDAMAMLHRLRSAVRSGPLDRPDEWPFTPHVTLHERHPERSIAAAVDTLSGVNETWAVDRVHLLEQRRRDDGSPVWIPVREEPLDGPTVVGRGGIEVVLRTVGMIEEPVAELCGRSPAGPLVGSDAPMPLVVVAASVGDPDLPIGAAVGSLRSGPVAVLHAVVVRPVARGGGTGAQLLAAWCSAAVSRGASLAVAPDGDGGFLERHGFSAAGDVLVRRL